MFALQGLSFAGLPVTDGIASGMHVQPSLCLASPYSTFYPFTLGCQRWQTSALFEFSWWVCTWVHNMFQFHWAMVSVDHRAPLPSKAFCYAYVPFATSSSVHALGEPSLDI